MSLVAASAGEVLLTYAAAGATGLLVSGGYAIHRIAKDREKAWRSKPLRRRRDPGQGCEHCGYQGHHHHRGGIL